MGKLLEKYREALLTTMETGLTESEMHQDEIKALFDRQAANYDAQWAKTVPIRNCLHLLLGSLFVELPSDARVLCVGVGTGDELVYLASKHPGGALPQWNPRGQCWISVDKGQKKKGLRHVVPSTKAILTHFQRWNGTMRPPASWYRSSFWCRKNAPGFSAKLPKGSSREVSSQVPIWPLMSIRVNTKFYFMPG
jgi:hypothetical protein